MNDAAPILRVQELQMRFGGFVALGGVDVEIADGERLGLIGPNGSGKTTLINCVSGALANYRGSIHFAGRDLSGLKPHQRTRLGIARSFSMQRWMLLWSVARRMTAPKPRPRAARPRRTP